MTLSHCIQFTVSCTYMALCLIIYVYTYHVIASVYVVRPIIYVHPMDRIIEINNISTNIVLTCMAHGALSYYWLKENHTIQPNTIENMTNSLLLANIMPSDNGRYQCVAENHHGRTGSNYAKLTVKGTLGIIHIIIQFCKIFFIDSSSPNGEYFS